MMGMGTLCVRDADTDVNTMLCASDADCPSDLCSLTPGTRPRCRPLGDLPPWLRVRGCTCPQKG